MPGAVSRLVADAIRCLSGIAFVGCATRLRSWSEQAGLPFDTPPERRLLHLIARMPGLQKLGQVLARNRHLHPSVRAALSELENGISDVDAAEIHSVILAELGSRLEASAVEIDSAIFAEATVSAVVRFTWWNAGRGQRERGVFKVLKPHITVCFAEDMALLQQLAEFVEAKHREYGFAARVLPDTLNDVRQLLLREVDFRREQESLKGAGRIYRTMAGVRVPRLILPLCTSRVTAITEEQGVKVTEAVVRMPAWRRARVAEQLIEALIALPLFAPDRDAMFHADPHAGNLLYDEQREQLVLLDWALTERLSAEQRRWLALLLLMMVLRDPGGVCQQIQALQNGGAQGDQAQAQGILACVNHFMERLPFTRLPDSLDAMRLLDRLALGGVRFPAPLLLWRKALFTLDGILHEVAGRRRLYRSRSRSPSDAGVEGKLHRFRFAASCHRLASDAVERVVLWGPVVGAVGSCRIAGIVSLGQERTGGG